MTRLGYQPLVSSIYHSVQHRLIEQTIAHPLAHDDVHFLYAIR